MKFVFWIFAAGFFYIYVGYPLLIWILARLRGRPIAKAPFEGRFSILIAAHNEADNLPGKIKSILESTAVARIDEIVIASDGSDDATADVVRDLKCYLVRPVEFKERRGKAAVLNDVLPACKAEIVVLMDARQAVHPSALEELASNFSDPSVGAVSGELVFQKPGSEFTDTEKGMDAYWRYEKFIRKQESRFRSVPGATGALYAIRKNLFLPFPAETILDDVAIPMCIVRQGFRCVFEEKALVYDRPSSTPSQESIRKRRTIAGNAQLAGLWPWLLNPLQNPIWFEFVSHKLARLLSPFLLLGLICSNLFLWNQPLYSLTIAGQIIFYTLTFLPQFGSAPRMFAVLNITAVLAIWDAMRGKYTVKWEISSQGAKRQGSDARREA